jgi:hypothetical protein
MSLARTVTVSGWAAGVFAVLGFAASLGRGPLPDLPGALTAPLAVLLFLAGGGAALLAGRRGVEIDRERFLYASDPHATRDEVREAHREAERRHKLAWTALAAAPILAAYWLAYELPAGIPAARALPVAPLAGFAAGLLLSRRRRSGERGS